MRIPTFAALTAALCFVAVEGSAAGLALKTADKPVPKEISESIRAVLQGKAIQLTQSDKSVLEIWLRQEVPLKSRPASVNEALGAIAETTVIGAIAVNDASLRDYKDNEIPKGVYTARFGLQPKDGDHLGTSEFDFFIVLIAAENDRDLAGLNKFRPLVKASGKSTASGHPLVLSLRPASGDGSSPRLLEPVAEHQAVRVRLPAKAESGEISNVILDLVYRGHGHVQ